MTKPKLSFWQIWNLSFGFLGVQIGYSLQNSNTSSIFESLGADVSHLSYFWLAAPLAGMIVQPIVGLFSDGTWTRWGRRIPYILGGSLISALALVLMPNCPKLLAFAPLAMGAFILLFMDLSFNVTMQPFRALVADMLDDSQKTQGYVVQTFLINLGAVVGAILPLVMTWLGVSDEAAPGHVSPHIAYSYYAGGAILLLTVLVTSFKTREYPPGEFARYNNLSEEDAKPMSFVGLMRNVPMPRAKCSRPAPRRHGSACSTAPTPSPPASPPCSSGASPRATATNPSTLPACSPGRWASRGCACCTTSTR